MASYKLSITAQRILAMHPGDILRDTQVKGLQVRAFSKGCAFYLYYRTTDTGQERKPKLGDYPAMDIKTARKKAADMLADVAAGGDPSRKRQALRQAPTLCDLADQYMERHGKSKKTARNDRYLWDKYLLPKLGKHTLVQDVDHDDIDKMHRSLAETPYQANRVLALTSKAFNLAEVWKWRPTHSNPCHHVTRYTERRRRRKMEAEEAAKIGRLLRRYAQTHPQGVAFIWLLIFTGARPNELARTLPEDVHGNKIVLFEHKTAKHTGDVRTVYLPAFVRDIVQNIPRVEGQTLLGIRSPRKLWHRIRSEAGCPDLQLRDLRRSYASVALAAGYQLDQIGELFNHSNIQTTKGYAWLLDEAAQEASEDIGLRLEQRLLNP